MTLYQRDSGIWYASFYDTERSPKQKRISLRTKNKKVASEKAEIGE